MKKRKLIKEPPMVILIDILTLFLMITLLQQEPSVKISFPPSPYKGVKLIDNTSAQESKKAYILVKVKDWGNRVVRIDGNLLKEMSEAYFIACLTHKRVCSDVVLPVRPDGRFDLEAFRRLNRLDAK